MNSDEPNEMQLTIKEIADILKFPELITLNRIRQASFTQAHFVVEKPDGGFYAPVHYYQPTEKGFLLMCMQFECDAEGVAADMNQEMDPVSMVIDVVDCQDGSGRFRGDFMHPRSEKTPYRTVSELMASGTKPEAIAPYVH